MKDPSFYLKGLEYLSQLEGYTFYDLSATYKRRLEEHYINVYKVRFGTPRTVIDKIISKLHMKENGRIN